MLYDSSNSAFDITVYRIRYAKIMLGCVDIYRIIDNHSVMTRLTLSDAQWAKIAPYCAGKETDVGRTAVNNRLFIEAVLWIVRTGSPWRDLPPEFGNWNSVYKRYSHLTTKML